MDNKETNLRIKSKLWIEKENDVVFGLGRIKIFEAIEQTGSMSQAAIKLGMSYRAAWGKVKATEERLQLSLVERQQGNYRKGTKLTPAGKELLARYREFEKEAYEQIDTLFDRHLGQILQHLNDCHEEAEKVPVTAKE